MSQSITVEELSAERRLVQTHLLGKDMLREAQRNDAKDPHEDAFQRLRERAQRNGVRVGDSVLRRIAKRQMFRKEADEQLTALRKEFEASQRKSAVKGDGDRTAAIKKTTGAGEGIDPATGKTRETAKRIASDTEYVDLPNPSLPPLDPTKARPVVERLTRHLVDDNGQPLDLDTLAQEIHAALRQRAAENVQSQPPTRKAAALGRQPTQPVPSMTRDVRPGTSAPLPAPGASARLMAGLGTTGAPRTAAKAVATAPYTSTARQLSSPAISGYTPLSGSTGTSTDGLLPTTGYKYGGLGSFSFGALFLFMLRDMQAKFDARRLAKEQRFLAHKGRLLAVESQQAMLTARRFSSIAESLVDTRRQVGRTLQDSLSQDRQQHLAGDRKGLTWMPERDEHSPLMEHPEAMQDALREGDRLYRIINGLKERGKRVNEEGLRDSLENNCESPFVIGRDRRALAPSELDRLANEGDSKTKEMLKEYHERFAVYDRAAGQASKYGLYCRESERLQAQARSLRAEAAADGAAPKDVEKLKRDAKDIEAVASELGIVADTHLAYVENLARSCSLPERFLGLVRDAQDYHKTWKQIRDSGEALTGSRTATQKMIELHNRGEGMRRAMQVCLEDRKYLRDRLKGKIHHNGDPVPKSKEEKKGVRELARRLCGRGESGTLERRSDVGWQPGDQVTAAEGRDLYETLAGSQKLTTDPEDARQRYEDAEKAFKERVGQTSRRIQRTIPTKALCKKQIGLRREQIDDAVNKAVESYHEFDPKKLNKAIDEALSPGGSPKDFIARRDVREAIKKAIESNPSCSDLKEKRSAWKKLEEIKRRELKDLRVLQSKQEEAISDHARKKVELLETKYNTPTGLKDVEKDADLMELRDIRDAATEMFRSKEELINKRLGLRGRWVQSLERLEQSKQRKQAATADNTVKAEAEHKKAREDYIRCTGRLEEYKRTLGITEIDDPKKALADLKTHELSITRNTGDGIEINRTGSQTKADPTGLTDDDLDVTPKDEEELLADYEGRLEAGDLVVQSYGDPQTDRLALRERELNQVADIFKSVGDKMQYTSDGPASEVEGGQAEMRGNASRLINDVVRKSERMTAQLLNVMHAGSMIGPR